MIKVPERLPEPVVENRASRRINRRLSLDWQIEGGVIQAIVQFNEADDNRGTNLRSSNYLLGHSIFKGEAVGMDYVQAVRGLSITMDSALKARVCEPHQDWLARIKFTDYYKYPVNGTSLADIERMPLPLKEEDILRVARLFHDPFIWGHVDKKRVRDAVIFTAVEPLVHDVAVPKSLHPLRDRITAFYDYFASYLTAQNTDRYQDRDFTQMLAWGGGLFGRSLGLYLAASSGLAPSSVLKLFKERGVTKGWLGFGVSLDQIESEVKYAYPETGINAFPEDLHPYLAYEPEADKKAVTLLKEVYSAKSELGRLGVDFGPAQVKEAIEKIRKYKGVIKADLSTSDLEFAKFPMTGHPVIRGVAMALGNSKGSYGRNILFVLRFDDPNIYLTLELNGRSNKFYGIPGELSKRIPHIDDLLARDVIVPAVIQVEERHPELKPEPKIITDIRPKVDKTVPNINLDEPPKTDNDFDGEVKELEKPLKRKYIKVLGLSVGEPELPKLAQSFERRYAVDYDEEMVRRMMGRNTRESEIRQIIEVIRRFETGGVRYRKVANQGTVRIKSARYRVIFTYEGGNSFFLTDVETRAEAYRR